MQSNISSSFSIPLDMSDYSIGRWLVQTDTRKTAQKFSLRIEGHTPFPEPTQKRVPLAARVSSSLPSSRLSAIFGKLLQTIKNLTSCPRILEALGACGAVPVLVSRPPRAPLPWSLCER